MNCKNCNNQLADDATFCGFCGAKVEVPEQVAVAATANNRNNLSGNSAQGELEEQLNFATEELSNPVVPDSSEEPEVEEKIKKPRRFKKLKITLIVLAALLAVGSVTYFVFGKTIFFAVAPEKYVGYLLSNTVEGALEEEKMIEENVFGFDVDVKEDFSAGVEYDYKDSYADSNGKVTVSNNAGDKNMAFEFDINVEDNNLAGEGFIDNENAGIMLPGSKGKYLTVPSKNFGDEYKKSDGYARKYIKNEDPRTDKILRSLDLSYDEIIGMFSSESEENELLSNCLEDNLLEFLESCEIGDRNSIDFTFDNGTESAYEITMKTDTKTVLKFFKGYLQDIRADETLAEKFGKDELDEMIEAIDDGIDEVERTPIEIKLVEYDSKIVSISIYIEEDDDDYESEGTITISATDKDYLLNGIKVTFDSNSEYDGEYGRKRKSKDIIGYSANWCTEDEEIKVTFYIEEDYEYKYNDGEEYDGAREAEAVLTLDYNNEVWTLDVDSSSDSGYDHSETFSGRCFKDNGVEFTVDEEWEEENNYYEMDYSEWYEYHYGSWLQDQYDIYRDDYLDFVYYDRFYYSYDSYSEWYNSSSRPVWDVADYDFENWLYSKSDCGYSDTWDVYYDETEVNEKVDANCNVKIFIKPESMVKPKDAGKENILNWSKSDFEEFAEDFQDEVR